MSQEQISHRVILEERQKLTMTGVTEVVSFDENAVVLQTGLGSVSIHGRELQLKNMSAEGGQIALQGYIAALIYEEPRSGGWLSRLFG